MKDPALLWYWNDWDGGTKTMNRHLKGCYMDLLSAQFNSGPLSLEEIRTVLGNDFAAWGVLQKKFKKTDNGLFCNERMEREKAKRKAYTESRRQSTLKSDEDNVKIFIIHDLDTDNYRIGSSKDPIRRFSDIIKQRGDDASDTRNYELYWISNICKRRVETTLQAKYENQRVSGDWFALTQENISDIDKTYGGSYVTRTLFRTENENDIILKKKDSLIEEKEIKEEDINKAHKRGFYFESIMLNAVFADFLEMRKKIKKPATPKAIELLISKLNKLSDSDAIRIQILERSIVNSWQDIFQLKELEYNGNTKRNSKQEAIFNTHPEPEAETVETHTNITNW